MVAMPLFLAAVNHLVTEADGVPAVPLWMKTLPPVTFASLTDDMFFYLAMNNVNASVILGPNPLAATHSIIARMIIIELDPFIQAAMAALPPGITLATMYLIMDRTVAHVTPIDLSPSQPPFRQVFELMFEYSVFHFCNLSAQPRSGATMAR
ncbi:Aste57867_13018 [Aphanomyces stellatus]|uniref:Aste57867_13018 protein n=1 Tax=Aphanomyces stellatus TaxID=120398 RepID=A0A485KXI7_9STRA|nr:hypothetical protein As57867_012970 [Aphanomyces stellatus]VFT89863.1 Aste57867_13018 [Aphanomyces stellatus]